MTEFKQYYLDLAEQIGLLQEQFSQFTDLGMYKQGQNTILKEGGLQSATYVKGARGWRLSDDGNLEANEGEFRGALIANSIDIPDTVTASSFHVDSDGDTWWGAATLGAATASILKDGTATFTDVTVTGGSISGTPISSIPNDSDTDISLLEYTHNLAFSVTDADTVAWATGTITLSNGRTFSITGANTGNMAARTYIYLDPAVSSTLLQTTTTVATAIGADKILIAVAQNGTGESTFQVYGGIGGLQIGSSQMNIANNAWTFSGAFSVTDADTVAWGAGTLRTSGGDSYSIGASNTGNMTQKVYIYFDLSVSSTAFQTTTNAATAVGDGKILIATARNRDNEAEFFLFNDNQMNIDASQLTAGSIVANNIAAGSVVASKLNVTQLAAISADLGAVTAGTITLDNSGHVKGGQTSFDTGMGFFLGLDASVHKFSIGDSAGDKMTWDGSNLRIKGNIELSSILNLPSFAVADLPIPSTSDGPQSPTAEEPGPISINSELIFKSADAPTITQAFTVNPGASKVLIVYIVLPPSENVPSSITYNGDAMTLIDNTGFGVGESVRAYILLNPDEGTNNLVISGLNVLSNKIVSIVALNGVAQDSTPDSDTATDTLNSSWTINIATAADDWVLTGVGHIPNSGFAGDVSASTGTLVNNLTDLGAVAGNMGLGVVRNTATGTPTTTAGSIAESNSFWGAIIVRLQPSEFTNPTNAFSSNDAYATAGASSGVVTVEVSKDGGATFHNALQKTYTGTEGSQTYGDGSSELWGSSFVGSDMDDGNFVVKVTAGNSVQLFTDFGFSITGTRNITGIEIIIEAKFATSTVSIDHITVTAYHGTSLLPIQGGSIAYASDGRKAGEGAGSGTGVLVFFDEATNWIAVDTGAAVAA